MSYMVEQKEAIGVEFGGLSKNELLRYALDLMEEDLWSSVVDVRGEEKEKYRIDLATIQEMKAENRYWGKLPIEDRLENRFAIITIKELRALLGTVNKVSEMAECLKNDALNLKLIAFEHDNSFSKRFYSKDNDEATLEND